MCACVDRYHKTDQSIHTMNFILQKPNWLKFQEYIVLIAKKFEQQLNLFSDTAEIHKNDKKLFSKALKFC